MHATASWQFAVLSMVQFKWAAQGWKEDVSVITGAAPVDFTWWLEATQGTLVALVSQAQPAKPNYTQQTQADD